MCEKNMILQAFCAFSNAGLQDARRFIEICSFINLHFNWNFDNEQAQISKARKSKKVALFKFQAVLVKVWPNSCQLSQNSENRKAFQFTTSIYIDKVLYSIKINNYKQLISISNSLESNIKTKTKLCANKMTMTRHCGV